MALYKSGQFGDSFPESATTLVEIATITNNPVVEKFTLNLTPLLIDMGIDYTTLTAEDFIVYAITCAFGNGGSGMAAWRGASCTPIVESYDNTNGRIRIAGLYAKMSGDAAGSCRAAKYTIFLKLS